MGYGMLGSCIKKIIIAVPFFFLSFFKFLGKCLWICEVCFVDECICFERQRAGLNLLLKYQYMQLSLGLTEKQAFFHVVKYGN